VTQRYSKRQLKWIRNRFLGSDTREVPLVYPLDTSNVSEWMQKVYTPAEDTILSYINEDEIKLGPLSEVERRGKGYNGETSNYCEICQRTFVGEFQWFDHMKSNKHKKMKQKRQREEKTMSQ
jgi:tRNA dimethylallyltransferase